MQTFPSKLIAKKQLTPHVFLFQFSTENTPDFTFQAGQYIIIHVPQPDGSTARRLYSIASPPSQKGMIELVIEIVPDGVGSRYVSDLNEGDEVTLQGPAGLFTLQDQNYSHSGQPLTTSGEGADPESISRIKTTDQYSDQSIIFLATGTGIAPIRSMIQSFGISDFGFRISLLWGLKHYTDTYFLDEFTDLAKKHNNFSFTVCLSQEKHSTISKYPYAKYLTPGRMTKVIDMIIEKGKDKHPPSSPPLTQGGMGGVTSNIQPLNPTTHNLQPTHYYLCGGRQAVEGIKTSLLEKGITKDQLHFEKF